MEGNTNYLKSLANILEASYRDYQSVLDCFSVRTNHTDKTNDKSERKTFFENFLVNLGGPNGVAPLKMNRLIRGDNILFMEELLTKVPLEKIDLIYIDPPFFSKTHYDAVVKLASCNIKNTSSIRLNAYQDYWNDGIDGYLKMLLTRCYLMRDLLSDTGSFWIHLDWHVVHYVKVLLDEVFGQENFVNEIIWQYKSGGSSSRRFSRKHDTLLFYSKSPKYYFHPQKEKSYNRNFKPYRFKGVTEYRDENGWYTLVNQKDVWPIDMVGRTSKERTGYATQKPEALISLIVESCTKPGDLCADFFGGSGTLASVAHKTGRRFYSFDMGKVAQAHSVSRMALSGADFVVENEKSDNVIDEGISPKVSFDVEVIDSDITSKKILNINIKDYRVDMDSICCSEEGKTLLSEFIQEDPIGMIEYWSVDANYDGSIHRSTGIMAKHEGRIALNFQEIGDVFHRISIVGADILGNTFKKEYTLS